MDIHVEDIPQSDQPAVSPSPALSTDTHQHLVLAERFNIDTPNKEENEKLKDIYRHAWEQSETKDIRDIILQVIHLEQTLGSPRLGEARIDRLYRYVTLRRQERQIQEEIADVSLGSGL